MAVESTGRLKLRGDDADGKTDINEEVNGNVTDTDVSLTTLSTTVGKTAPHSMSEFYGYASTASSSIAWVTGDDSGNLFYTGQADGLTGWTAGPQLGSSEGYLNDAVFNGTIWMIAMDGGIWKTEDTDGLTGWTKIHTPNNAPHQVMWVSNGWVWADRYRIYSTSDTNPTTSSTVNVFYDSSTSSTYTVRGRMSNDGSRAIQGVRDQQSNVEEWNYSNIGLNNITSMSDRDMNFTAGFARGMFWDDSTSNYILYGIQSNIRYSTIVNPNNTGISAASSKTLPLSQVDLFDYNGTYYIAARSSTSTMVVSSATNFTGTWSSATSVGSVGSEIDRMSAYHVGWNGTSWGMGCRNTSTNTNMCLIRNASDPAGDWTGIAQVGGFSGNRTKGVWPSYRPYYNTLTNLGS